MRVVPIFPLLIVVALAGTIFPGKQQNVFHENIIASDTVPAKARYLKTFVPDDYPVTNEMLKSTDSGMWSGNISSSDIVWFRNDTLNQTLVFELYTDYHRLVTYHFKNNDIPPAIINRIELHSEGDLASAKAKKKAFPGFIKQAKIISQKYFRSNKGFRLGDSLEKIIKIYGKADKISEQNGIMKYEWDYVGDDVYDPKKDKGKKIAQFSFGHQAILFFRNKKLIGLILHNDIP